MKTWNSSLSFKSFQFLENSQTIFSEDFVTPLDDFMIWILELKKNLNFVLLIKDLYSKIDTKFKIAFSSLLKYEDDHYFPTMVHFNQYFTLLNSKIFFLISNFSNDNFSYIFSFSILLGIWTSQYKRP